jgi:hypothetical protein
VLLNHFPQYYKDFNLKMILTGFLFSSLALIFLFFIINGISVDNDEHLTILLPISLVIGVIIFYLCNDQKEGRQRQVDISIYSIAIIYVFVVVYSIIFENRIIYNFKLHHFFWIGLLLSIFFFQWPFSIFRLYRNQLPRPLLLFFFLTTILLIFSPTKFTKDFMHISLQVFGWIVLYQCVSIKHGYRQIDLILFLITILFWVVFFTGLLGRFTGIIDYFSALNIYNMFHFGSAMFSYEGTSGQYFRLWAAWACAIHLYQLKKNKNIRNLFQIAGAFCAFYVFWIAYGRTSFIAVMISFFLMVTVFIYYKKNIFFSLLFLFIISGVSMEGAMPIIQTKVLRMYEKTWDSNHLDIWKQHQMILKDYYITGGGWALKENVLREYLPTDDRRKNNLLSERGTTGEGEITGLYARRGVFAASLLIMFSVMTIFEWIRINKTKKLPGEQARSFILIFMAISYCASLVSQGALLSVSAPNDFIFSYIVITMWILNQQQVNPALTGQQ